MKDRREEAALTIMNVSKVNILTEKILEVIGTLKNNGHYIQMSDVRNESLKSVLKCINHFEFVY